ncbi:MAG: glycosyltransferase, partial [Planctomycetes bacterium]|nr:glycosyltransferase [Planctomycetota bacterium]
MRILHLFANFKWTGPADPAIRCASWLRRIGCDVVFAQADWTLPQAEHRMAMELRRAHMPVIAGLELRKHFGAASLLRDAKRLRARLDRGEFDVLHAHLLADHLIAALAKRRAAHRPVVVRSLYEPEPPSRLSWRNRVALRYTDGVVVPTHSVEIEMRRRFGLESGRVLYQDPPIDSARRLVDGDLRGQWGVGYEDFLVGITARIQPHRRFDLLWQTLRAVVDRRPNTRLVLLGRGNEDDTRRLVREPIARLGL